MQYSFDCSQLIGIRYYYLLYYYVLLINQQFLIFHDVKVAFTVHDCLFYRVSELHGIDDTRDTCAVSRYFVLLRYTRYIVTLAILVLSRLSTISIEESWVSHNTTHNVNMIRDVRIPKCCVRISPRILTIDPHPRPRPQADAVSDPLSVRESATRFLILTHVYI